MIVKIRILLYVTVAVTLIGVSHIVNVFHVRLLATKVEYLYHLQLWISRGE